MWAQTLVAPFTFALAEVPSPTLDDLDPGEVLVEFLAGGVCGSDLPAVRGFFDPALHGYGQPGWPFHEIVGRVVQSRDERHQVGERVVGWTLRDGGLAQRFITQGDHLIELGSDISDVVGTIVQSAAAVLSFSDRVISYAGKRVAIIGLGPYGLLHGAVAKDLGAAEVIGVDPIDRADPGAALGFDATVREASRSWSLGLSDAQRPDVVIDAVGHQQVTVIDAIEAVRPGGGVYVYGAPDEYWYALPFQRIFRKGLVLGGKSSDDHRRNLGRAQDLIRRRPEIAATLITGVFDRAHASEAFALASVPKPGQLKIVISEEQR